MPLKIHVKVVRPKKSLMMVRQHADSTALASQLAIWPDQFA